MKSLVFEQASVRKRIGVFIVESLALSTCMPFLSTIFVRSMSFAFPFLFFHLRDHARNKARRDVNSANFQEMVINPASDSASLLRAIEPSITRETLERYLCQQEL